MRHLRNGLSFCVLLLFLWGGAIAPVVHLGSHIRTVVPGGEHAAVADETPASAAFCLICEGLVFWVDGAPPAEAVAPAHAEAPYPASGCSPLSSTVYRSTSRAPPTTA